MVLQLELPSLQASDLQLVEQRLRRKGGNLVVQPPVLRFHRIKLFPDRFVHHAFFELPQSHFAVIAHCRDEPRLQSVGWTPTIRDKASEKCFTADAVQTHSEKGMSPMDKANAEELSSQHASLAAQIDEEEHRPLPDMIKLHELKKEKLRLKDELAGHFH